MATARFIVTGRVQGVGFRAASRAQALRLGLSGHARNLADGSVEVVATGDDVRLAVLESWLQVGPVLARVDAVSRHHAEDGKSDAGFTTG